MLEEHLVEYFLEDPVATGAEPLDATTDREGEDIAEPVVEAKTLESAAGAVLDRDNVPVTGTVDGVVRDVAVFS